MRNKAVAKFSSSNFRRTDSEKQIQMKRQRVGDRHKVENQKFNPKKINHQDQEIDDNYTYKNQQQCQLIRRILLRHAIL